MRFSDTLRLNARITTHKPGRVAIVGTSVAIGSAVLLLFLSFANGLEQAVLKPILERSSPTTLVVRPEFTSLDFLTGGNKITEGVVDEVGAIPGVQSVGRQLFLGFPNSLEITLFGITFDSDIPVFGVDAVLLPQASEPMSPPGAILPLTISPHLIDLFNSSFADSVPGVSHLSSDLVLGQEMTLIFGRSSFFNINLGGAKPIEKRGQITTISPRVPPMGVSIPLEEALQMNEKFGGIAAEQAVFQQLYVEAATTAEVEQVQNSIRGMGYSARSFEELGEDVRTLANLVRIILLLAAGVILLIAFFSLSALVSVIVLEQRRTIGVLRALGESRTGVVTTFLMFSAIIAGLAVLVGIIVGWLVSQFLGKILADHLPDISLLAVDFFPFSLLLAIKIVVSVVAIALLFTYFPVRRAGKQGVLKLLWE